MGFRIWKATGAALIAASIGLPTFAQNRQSSDALFTEPRGSVAAQVLTGLGELVVLKLINPKLPEGTAIAEKDAKILAAVKDSTLTDELKLQQINAAETEAAKARLVGLSTMQAQGMIPSVIRSARVVGNVLIIIDVAQRAWIWTALRANPTYSPVLTQLAKVGRGLSTEHALPAQ
jgi:hypothetical protein